MTPEQIATASIFNYYLSLSTILGGSIIFAWICFHFYAVKRKKDSKLLSSIASYALPLGFIFTLGGSLMTLFYSEFLGYVPCGLCWLQRIFLYPQVVLFGLAWIKKDTNIFFYTMWLSILGLVVGFYQNYLQLGYSPLMPCPVTAVFSDCAVPPFIEFGFVTFPGMAVVLFSSLAILSATALRFTKRG